MSNPACQGGRMKLNRSNWFSKSDTEIIARFGAARLIRKLDGRHELIGGTPDDLIAAREWCSLFAHDLVFSPVRGCNSTRGFAA